MSDVACPVCGETSRLRGQQVGDARPADDEAGIEVWCGARGHVWRRDRAAPGGRTSPAARPLEDPTVRQATETYLGGAADADPVTLVMLGQHLGAATRLSRLGDPAGSDLASRVDGVWGASPSPRRSAAVSTVLGAVDHWRAAGWLAQDLAAGLR